MATKSVVDKAKKRLRQRLTPLQEKGELVWAGKRKTHLDMWRHVAEIYFFYVEAIKNEQVLFELYEAANIQHKKVIKHATNFSPLLRLIWGDANCSPDDIAKHSRALNAIDAHYRKKRSLYAKDGVSKLAEYIKYQGGISKLAGVSISQETPTPKESPDQQRSLMKKSPPPTPAARTAAIAKKIAPIIATVPAIAPVTDPRVAEHLEISDDKLGLLLIRSTAVGYEIVGSSRDPALISAVAADWYRRSFASLPKDLGCLLETLRTQCLPAHLQRIQQELVDVGVEGHTKEKKALATRRLLVMDNGTRLLLSPINALAGVVTIATITGAPWLPISDDLMLSYRARRRLEVDLISGYDFHLYNLLQPHRPVDYDSSHEIAYVARLQHSLMPDSKFLYLDFWRSEKSNAPPMAQVFAIIPTVGAIWTHRLSGTWFRRLAYEVLDRWLEGCGAHIKRSQHQVCRVTFTSSALEFEFDRKTRSFAIHKTQTFEPKSESQRRVSAFFQTKDLVPALRSLGDFEILDDVQVSVSDEVLGLEFATAAAKYQIVVPRTAENGARFTKHFSAYVPQQYVSIETEHGITDEQEDADDV